MAVTIYSPAFYTSCSYQITFDAQKVIVSEGILY